MTSEEVGFIYIMTNPAFPEVKIGFSKNPEQRRKDLSGKTSVPMSYQLYATYEVPEDKADKLLLHLIDIINPTVRRKEVVGNRIRKKEFVSLSPESLYKVLEDIAEMHCRKDKLMKYVKPDDATTLKKTRRRPNFSFAACGIPEGAVLEIWYTRNRNSGKTCTLYKDLKHVVYDGRIFSPSGLMKELLHTKSACGTDHLRYNDRWLNDIRNDMEREGDSSGTDSSDA